MRLLERWRRGETLAVLWAALDDPFATELLARQGFDIVCLDMQHGLIHEGSLLPHFQAAQQTDAHLLVRVPDNDAALLMKVLDLGAEGVIVPLVNSAAEAAAAVAACRYPPAGKRSHGPVRALPRYGPDYLAEANERVAVLAMIETADGLADLDAICATPGLTGVFIGPSDLGFALGLPPPNPGRHPEHQAAVRRIHETCKRHGLVTGIYSDDPAAARQAAAQGMQLVVVAHDTKLLIQGARERLEAFRGD